MQATFTLTAITSYADPNSGVRLEFEPPSPAVTADSGFWAGSPNGRAEIYVLPSQSIGFKAGQTFTIQFIQIS